ncbi:hypothetical protein PV10_04162 [Exophiala mesophila]|uniref:Uncharacterized protein n=1 Tax=Exophiala mesophila TaxID=212818 RepID=A0A0D2A1I9_EXOME|nr:uncharacterized protein PV10_04162 [Exophiala mesophila]KIV92903.1 hypothetical protein PV10_04162 [Exophiala mesophila]
MVVSKWPLLPVIIVTSLTAAIPTPTTALGFTEWSAVSRNVHQTSVQIHALCDTPNSIWAQNQEAQLKVQLCQNSCFCTQAGTLDCRLPGYLEQYNMALRCDGVCRCNMITASRVDSEPVEHFNHLLKGDEANALRQERLRRFMAEEGLDNADDDDDDDDDEGKD